MPNGRATRTVVASLTMEAAHDPDDQELAVLVGEMSVQVLSPEYASGRRLAPGVSRPGGRP
jgi:hypothetical protein